jgi:hypothetical protein
MLLFRLDSSNGFVRRPRFNYRRREQRAIPFTVLRTATITIIVIARTNTIAFTECFGQLCSEGKISHRFAVVQ